MVLNCNAYFFLVDLLWNSNYYLIIVIVSKCNNSDDVYESQSTFSIRAIRIYLTFFDIDNIICDGYNIPLIYTLFNCHSITKLQNYLIL